jgi:hypothetical protein
MSDVTKIRSPARITTARSVSHQILEPLPRPFPTAPKAPRAFVTTAASRLVSDLDREAEHTSIAASEDRRTQLCAPVAQQTHSNSPKNV